MVTLFMLHRLYRVYSTSVMTYTHVSVSDFDEYLIRIYLCSLLYKTRIVTQTAVIISIRRRGEEPAAASSMNDCLIINSGGAFWF